MIGCRITRRSALLSTMLGALAMLPGCVSPITEDRIPVFAECPQYLLVAKNRPDRNSANDELLYYMRLATIQQACRLFDDSAETFATAKRLAEDLYTKSISAETVSLMGNDAMRPYPGENFERAFLRILNALNYAAAGRPGSALVEARQLDFFLRELDQDQAGKNVYNEDAFGRYLTGMLHEDAGDIDSARISYLKALEAYTRGRSVYGVDVPPGLLASATAVAQRHGKRAVAEVRRYGRAEPRSLPDGAGEVVIVHQLGRVPDKREETYTISWSEGWDSMQKNRAGQRDADFNRALANGQALRSNNVFTVAFPVFVDRGYGISALRVSAPNMLSSGTGELVSNVGAIAKKDLADRIERIRSRTIARAAAYFAATEAVAQDFEKKNELMAASLTRLGNAVRTAWLEHADRRQWDSLPDKIRLVHVVLPEGRHSLKLHYLAGGAIQRSEGMAAQVTAGKRSFLVVRTYQ